MRRRRYFRLTELLPSAILKLNTARLTPEVGCHILRFKSLKPHMPVCEVLYEQ